MWSQLWIKRQDGVSGRLAAYQTSVRISDMAWNPHIPSFMAFVCEDGSLQMAEAASQVHSPRECRASAVPSKSRQALRYSMHQGMLLCPALDEVPGDEPGTFDTRTSLHQAFNVCIFLNGVLSLTSAAVLCRWGQQSRSALVETCSLSCKCTSWMALRERRG